jgi:DNA processing protein
MSPAQRSRTQAVGACAQCRRRSWLLAELSGPLEFCARDRQRLIETLALEDEMLIDALAGRRRAELQATYSALRFSESARGKGVESICRHSRVYPDTLDGPSAPRTLSVAGGVKKMARLTEAPMVAIVGSRAASDYGMQVGRGLARGLAASGVTVVSVLSDGVATAVLLGALEAGATPIAVLGSGLEVSPPTRQRALFERIRREGCAIAELPQDCGGRRWGSLASERIPVEMAQLSIVVEAEETEGDLFAARIAKARHRTVAAVPGRVSSPLSRGAHALLMEGASMVRDPQDALELLYASGASAGASRSVAQQGDALLEPWLLAVLERVGAGADTPAKLTRARQDHGETLLALSELELMGLLSRGDGGRYVPRYPLPTRAASIGAAWR